MTFAQLLFLPLLVSVGLYPGHVSADQARNVSRPQLWPEQPATDSFPTAVGLKAWSEAMASDGKGAPSVARPTHASPAQIDVDAAASTAALEREEEEGEGWVVLLIVLAIIFLVAVTVAAILLLRGSSRRGDRSSRRARRQRRQQELLSPHL